MKLNRKNWLCFTALAGIGVIAPGHLVMAEDVEDLGVIEVVGNYNGDRFAEDADRNASIYISEEAIRNAESGNLKDVFAEESSVSVGGGIPIAQKIYVNGVDMINLNVTIDGAMQNNRAFHHVSANAIDPGLLKAVRIDAGVAAADSGPHAVAGSVAFETKDALDLLKDGKDFGARAAFTAESNGKTMSPSLSAFGRMGGFDFLAYGKIAAGDNYRAGDDWKIDGTEADYQSVLGKLGYTSESGNRFELSAQTLFDGSQRPYRANFGNFMSPSQEPGTREYESVRKNFTFNFFTEDPEGYWDPEIVLGYSANEFDIQKIHFYNRNFVGHPVYGRYNDRTYDLNMRGESDTINGKLANTFHFGDRYRITAGADAYKKASNYTSNPFHADPTTNAVINGISPAEDLSEETINFGAFAQARLNPIDPLKLSFGARYDSQHFEGANGQEIDVDGASANASVAYEVFDGVTLQAGYSNIFGGIDMGDNFLFGNLRDTSRALGGTGALNANAYDGLKASRSENFTAGIEVRKWSVIFSGEFFKTEVENARKATDARTRTVGNTDFSVEGFNLGLGYIWEGGRAKLTYTNSELKVNGASPGSYESVNYGAPIGDVLAFSIQHTFAPYDMTLGANIDAALEYDGKGGSSNIPFPGYAVVNMFAEYQPKQVEGLSVRVDVKNLFDEDYADRTTYGGDYNGNIKPLKEPGRSFLATLRYHF